jgi:hypothetical protein
MPGLGLAVTIHRAREGALPASPTPCVVALVLDGPLVGIHLIIGAERPARFVRSVQFSALRGGSFLARIEIIFGHCRPLNCRGFAESSAFRLTALHINDQKIRNPSPEALGPACRLRRRYAHAPAGAFDPVSGRQSVPRPAFGGAMLTLPRLPLFA